MELSLLLSRLKRILAHYRAGGFTRVLKHLLHYSCVHNWVLWLADIRILGLVGASETKTLQPLTGYTFGFATESDLNAILTSVPVADRNQYDKLFRKFFHEGYRCVIVLFDKHVAGYLWAFTGEYVITLDDYRRCNLSVRLPSGAVFIGNAYVVPAHRGHGLYRRMSLYLMRHCPPNACFYASISDLNAPSLAVNHKLGFKELATVRFIGVFSHTLLYIRENATHRWRSFRTRRPNVELDGARLRTVFQDSPYSTPSHYSPAAALRWPRVPMRMRQERRKTSAFGRPTLSKSPPKSAQL
jgi:GNAT superfamily N-acetyltransferase